MIKKSLKYIDIIYVIVIIITLILIVSLVKTKQEYTIKYIVKGEKQQYYTTLYCSNENYNLNRIKIYSQNITFSVNIDKMSLYTDFSYLDCNNMTKEKASEILTPLISFISNENVIFTSQEYNNIK